MTGRAKSLSNDMRALRAHRPTEPSEIATQLPPEPPDGFRLHKVSPSGQFTLPARARRDLDVVPRGYVDIVQLASGVVIKRAFDRLGYVKEPRRAHRTVNIRSFPNTQSYKVSNVGQLSLPAQSRRAWNIKRGGFVEAAWVGDALIILPLGGSSVLLRDWLRMNPAEGPTVAVIHRVDKSTDFAWNLPQNKVLLAGSLLARLLCGLTIPGVGQATRIAVTWPEYAHFAAATVDQLSSRDMPLSMRLLNGAASDPIGVGRWLALLLDLERARARHGDETITLTIPSDAKAPEAAVCAHYWGVSERMATNLIVARDEGIPIYTTTDAITDCTDEALQQLGLTRTTILDPIHRQPA